MKPNVNLLMLDFAEAHRQDPRTAARALQNLLTDQLACRGRTIFHEQLGALVPDPTPIPEPGDFDDEIALLAAYGPVEAVEQNLVDPDRIAALLRDPQALRLAQEVVSVGMKYVKEDTSSKASGTGAARLAAPTGETAVTPATDVGGGSATVETWTALAAAGKVDDLVARLARLLPEVLETARWSQQLAEPLRDFVARRLRQTGLQERRFRDVFPEWLAEFAQEQGLAAPRAFGEADWLAISERALLRQVLEEAATEPGGRQERDEPWKRSFCQLALSTRLGSAVDILHLEPPEEQAAPGLPYFRRYLFDRIREEQQANRHQLELD